MANPINELYKKAKEQGRFYVECTPNGYTVSDSVVMLTGAPALELLRKFETRPDSLPEGSHKYTHISGNNWEFNEGEGPDFSRVIDQASTLGNELIDTKLQYTKQSISGRRTITTPLDILGDYLGYMYVQAEYLRPLLALYPGAIVRRTQNNGNSLQMLALYDMNDDLQAAVMPVRIGEQPPSHLRDASEVFPAPEPAEEPAAEPVAV